MWQEYSNSSRQSVCKIDCDSWVIQDASAKYFTTKNSQQQARGAHNFTLHYNVMPHMANVSDLWHKHRWEVLQHPPSRTIWARQTLICSQS
jgi:hypothetical protein